MVDVTFQKATLAHVESLAVEMRAADVAEVLAASGSTPLDALTRGLKISEVCGVVCFNGEVGVMFGVIPLPLATALGESRVCLWFLTGRVVDSHRLAFIRALKRIRGSLLRVYPVLCNWVDERYAGAVWVLRHLGVRLSEPVPYGVGGELFRFGVLRREYL